MKIFGSDKTQKKQEICLNWNCLWGSTGTQSLFSWEYKWILLLSSK